MKISLSSGSTARRSSIRPACSMTVKLRSNSEGQSRRSWNGLSKYTKNFNALMPTKRHKAEEVFPYFPADIRCLLVTQRCDIKPCTSHTSW
jgi:hypothetical protein